LNTSAGFGLSGLNRNTGKSPGGAKSYGLRGTFRWQPADTIDLKLKVYASEAEGGTEPPIATGSSKTSDVINYTNPNFLLGGLFAALAPAGLVPSRYSRDDRGLSERQIEDDTIGNALSRARGAVFDARIDLSDSLKLISVTGYDCAFAPSATSRSSTPSIRTCGSTTTGVR
jgi:iron complex outermembrane receptor protein